MCSDTGNPPFGQGDPKLVAHTVEWTIRAVGLDLANVGVAELGKNRHLISDDQYSSVRLAA